MISQKKNETSLTRSEWKIVCAYEIKAIINYVRVIGNANVERQNIDKLLPPRRYL